MAMSSVCLSVTLLLFVWENLTSVGEGKGIPGTRESPLFHPRIREFVKFLRDPRNEQICSVKPRNETQFSVNP